MDIELQDTILKTWSRFFGLEEDILRESGTTLLIDEKRTVDDWLSLWQAGQQIVLTIPPEFYPMVQNILKRYPHNHGLSIGDFICYSQESVCEVHQDIFYVIDWAQFQPRHPSEVYTTRILNQKDQARFQLFLSECSEDDIDEGDVSLDYELTLGILDGERIVSAASIFEWRKFVDIGVLVHPQYRHQGLGTVNVSELCHELRGDNRVIVYRHDINNQGSRGIAKGLNLQFYAVIESLKLKM